MYQPQLLINPETGEMALNLKTLGAELTWRLPDTARRLQGKELIDYLSPVIESMTVELRQKKITNQRRLRRKHGSKKDENRSKQRKDAKKRNLKAAEESSAAPADATGL